MGSVTRLRVRVRRRVREAGAGARCDRFLVRNLMRDALMWDVGSRDAKDQKPENQETEARTRCRYCAKDVHDLQGQDEERKGEEEDERGGRAV